MPTYEYECKKCSYNFELFQAMSDAPVKECPKCGSEVRRIIFGGTGVIFKGSGFYVNDKSKTGNSETKSKKTDIKTENKADKPDSKADSKAETCAGCPASDAGKCPAAASNTESKSA